MAGFLQKQRDYTDRTITANPWRDRTAMSPLADFTEHSTLFQARRRLPNNLAPYSILIVNCGAGVDARFFQVEGVHSITVTDISSAALRLTRSHCPGAQSVMADTAHLPFADDAFDLVGVRSGLHHLEQPLDGLREMARVARFAFFGIEGHATPLVPLLVKLGALEAEEEAGNPVFRFKPKDTGAWALDAGAVHCTIETGWFFQIPALVRWSHHVPGAAPAVLWRGFVQAFNALFGPLGNAFIFVAQKRPWKQAAGS